MHIYIVCRPIIADRKYSSTWIWRYEINIYKLKRGPTNQRYQTVTQHKPSYNLTYLLYNSTCATLSRKKKGTLIRQSYIASAEISKHISNICCIHTNFQLHLITFSANITFKRFSSK